MTKFALARDKNTGRYFITLYSFAKKHDYLEIIHTGTANQVTRANYERIRAERGDRLYCVIQRSGTDDFSIVEAEEVPKALYSQVKAICETVEEAKKNIATYRTQREHRRKRGD